MPNRLAATLKRAREQKRLSVAELSVRSGVSHQMIANIEKGDNVSVETLTKLARTLGVPELPVGDNLTLVIPDAELVYFVESMERMVREASTVLQVARDLQKASRPTRRTEHTEPANGAEWFERLKRDFDRLPPAQKDDFIRAMSNHAYQEIQGTTPGALESSPKGRTAQPQQHRKKTKT